MKAVTWQGKNSVSVEQVPDPTIQEPTDAIIRVTSTAVCGSDLHLYGVLLPYMKEGDILGHEAMGIVEEVGSAVTSLKKGDRVVVPFQIACGSCFMCRQGLQTQCEVTQVREKGSGAALFGFSELYGSVPGGQAEYLRVPLADYNPIKVGTELPDHRYLFLSDILPTAWQGVQYANVPDGGTLAVYGLGPVGQFAARIGTHLGYRVIGVEPVEERRKLAGQYGVETLDLHKDVADELREMTDGRGPDSVVDAVGMEAHGSPVGKAAQTIVGLLPDKLAQKAMETAGTDRLSALHGAIDAVRRGGTVSLSGVYGGTADPMNLMAMFDKQLNLRMGQCNVKRWTEDLMPLVEDPADPLGVTNLVTHQASLEDAPELYEKFQKKEDGCIKVVFQPGASN
ncbi:MULTISPECIES: zinc-dependent alcohol dehydrogenase [unclassified Arthrobacter]|uniref:zinc-dependent alcohol dehydrogenase n=1 Tax=unclassified Arthrobacter TaxID=235627 RepID=UPI001D1542F1|nr:MULTISPECIES: zinc-dependent alcohol dehydrogenase [unclassified Arthrobacter]MCC3278829.1 glutathione-dependent formaldehyde dehydrogenase [Arthrobacter sp. zg-Y40]MCC9177203.1 glutathione-dependent formaldehyde dehydrogenase [Arthrobacter sp. zg-Y750]MCC3275746.1 glutathione-dependent formaldehyde dehydrogenase [Arthrobacter sp. zg-Y20]MDK1315903.1 zinc-dependent alcohol dehydrogenase [Arthrobacter sp. zg.Y20]MDK1326098.1 zinc-dependent alcohol dehydrogenase [Arthrobacter sp. zg-Y1143]